MKQLDAIALQLTENLRNHSADDFTDTSNNFKSSQKTAVDQQLSTEDDSIQNTQTWDAAEASPSTDTNVLHEIRQNFDLAKAVIYSEFLKPKFEDE